MLVEINQWRATIGCFRISQPSLFTSRKTVRPFLILFQIFKLLYFCCRFIAISFLVLPVSLITHFVVAHSTVAQLCFLSILARVNYFVSIELYVSAEILKRITFGVFGFARKKYFLSQYAYYHTACIVCYMLCIRWSIFRSILLIGDIEVNPGPDTLSFCCWNLNSITAHDFLRVSLIEAYNSVYNNDLIGIVETHLDDTVDADRLALDGYSLYKANHPRNV